MPDWLKRTIAIILAILGSGLLTVGIASAFGFSISDSIQSIANEWRLSIAPFSPDKDADIAFCAIPYEAFKSRALYDDYLCPLMVKLGFPEDGGCFLDERKKTDYCYKSDKAIRLDNYWGEGYFKIPNSRYALSFFYKIQWVTAEEDYYGDFDWNVISGNFYDLEIYIAELNGDGTTNSRYKTEVFSDHSFLIFLDNWPGYDPSDYIFDRERYITEIQTAVIDLFDVPDIKEMLLIEFQSNNR